MRACVAGGCARASQKSQGSARRRAEPWLFREAGRRAIKTHLVADAVGLTMDGTGFGMGTRCKRMAMIVDKGVVKHGKIVFGAIGFGALKIALQRACVARLFESNDITLDAPEIYATAKTMVG
jgi:hypothetical protein